MTHPTIIAEQIYALEDRIHDLEQEICELHYQPIVSEDGEVISYADYLSSMQ